MHNSFPGGPGTGDGRPAPGDFFYFMLLSLLQNFPVTTMVILSGANNLVFSDV
jgi:hypothetical protein